jgi:hypothetical protein
VGFRYSTAAQPKPSSPNRVLPQPRMSVGLRQKSGSAF